ncbi:MAG: DASS family sodium-coupled anion symporter [Deltaproteobacteria bacterium]|nr:DASS family sodium-coupled anion symporter [Deltaproteobacteria bacterium]
MSIEIDKRPLWVILLSRLVRPAFFALLAIAFYVVVRSEPPAGLSEAGKNALAVFGVCLALWVSNVIPLAVTSILAMVLVPLLGVLTRKDVYATFGNEAVFFILGAFILAGAVMQSGLSSRISLVILDKFAATPERLWLSVFFLAASLSFFMSEHAVAAMLFPIVLDMSKTLGLRPGKSSYGKLLFLSLAWGCVIGGVATFLGGARVPLAVGILKELTGKSIDFIDYTIAVFPLVIALLIVGYLVLRFFFVSDVENVDKVHETLKRRIHAMGKIKYAEYAVGAVLLVTIAAWALLGKTAGLSTIALVAVVALFVFKLVRWKDIEEYVNWGVILMYGGAIVLGSALDKSGAAFWFAKYTMGNWVTTAMAAVVFFSFVTLVLTEGISNAAVIAILLPVAIGLSGSFGMSPELVTLAIAIPAGLAFCLPMSTPANAIAVSSNFVTVKDMAKTGVIMTVAAWVLFNVMAAYYWPVIGVWK